MNKLLIFTAATIIGSIFVVAVSRNVVIPPPQNLAKPGIGKTHDNTPRSDEQYEAYAKFIETADLNEQYSYIYTETEKETGVTEEAFDSRRNQFKKALAYFKSMRDDLSSFWFWSTYRLFENVPRYAVLDETEKIKHLLPFRMRVIEETPEKLAMPNYTDYTRIVGLLSQHRKSIDFNALYTNFKPIIHSVIDKETYNEKYADFVERLLIAYEDLDSDVKYEKVDAVMRAHFARNLSRNVEDKYTEDLSFYYDYYDDFESIMSKEALAKLKAIPYPLKNGGDNGSYMFNYATIWTYSFWNRRKMEGKKDEIYQLLKSVRDDYQAMK